MGVKVADKFVAMGDFELLDAQDVLVDIEGTPKRLQEAIDNGELGGSGSGSGEENAIKSISINGGTPLTPDENKNIDITVPTVTNDLTNELKANYDSAVKEKHVHNNKTVIDKLSESSDGKSLLFNNNKITGENGKSAYEIAVDNGFSGTDTEWIASLKGEKGDKGETGEKGEQGPAGGPNVFENSEVVIGSYAGATLYRRTITKTITPIGSAGTQTVTSLLNTGISPGNVTNLYGRFYISAAGTTFPLPQIKNDTACYRRNLMMDSRGTIQFQDSINDGRSLTVIATVEYIK